MLTSEFCQARRGRLLEWLADRRLDGAIVTDVRDVYYLTGRLFPAELPIALVLSSGGETTLYAPADFEPPEVDRCNAYRWNIAGTKSPDLLQQLFHVAEPEWRSMGWRSIGIQQQSLPHAIGHWLDTQRQVKLTAIDKSLADMQSRKDPDEVEAIRAAIRANQGAYLAVSQAIRPGVTELEVLAAGIGGAMQAAGSKLFHDGDYRSGQYNGPARNRPIEAGELYIVDAWTYLDGYWSDMSRTYCVGREPTEVQQALYQHLLYVHGEVAELLKPGVDGRDVFRAVDTLIREHPPLADCGLTHHGGHAIGLRNHEMPDLNRDRGGTLQPGNILCVEPGGYFDEARQGVRLENMYLITDDGCEDLCDEPGELMVCGSDT